MIRNGTGSAHWCIRTMRLGEYLQTPQPCEDGLPRLSSASEPDKGETEGARLAIGDEAAALRSLGFSKPLIAKLTALAARHKTTVENELLHHPGIDETAYYGAMARFLRLSFIERIDGASVVDIPDIDTQLAHPTQVRINHPRRAPQVAIVPQAKRLAELAAALGNLPALRSELAITTPNAIRQAVWTAGAKRRTAHTIGSLFERKAHYSARIVLTGGQGFAAGTITAGLLAALMAAPSAILSVLHPFVSVFFLISLAPRIVALFHRAYTAPIWSRPPPGPLPCYTVMIALYREAAVAAQLVRSLQRLDWPSALLDIKLVCEADDSETISALTALELPRHFEIVAVPAAQPRTKPKALTYALSAARGEFVVIYDAEDRPHPGQLREAFTRFRAAPCDLVCLQAPLIVTNAGASWISGLFSLEYSALFRGLLPMLARYHLPLPLGGTSNHFRTRVLQEVGGWDPFNVTEDADLGMRLYRLGYRAGVLERQTLEDAPTSLPVWIGQRTRWFKGWMQTWLVMMRNPKSLAGEMGLPAWFTFQMLIGGMLVSSLLHPLVFVFLVNGAFAMLSVPASGIPAGVLILFVIDAVNIFGSYIAFVALGITTMTHHERILVGPRWMGVPLYWLLTSLAAWRALIELRRRPFFWQKTPHKPA